MDRQPTMRNGAPALGGWSRLGGLMALRDRLHGGATRVDPAPASHGPRPRSAVRASPAIRAFDVLAQ